MPVTHLSLAWERLLRNAACLQSYITADQIHHPLPARGCTVCLPLIKRTVLAFPTKVIISPRSLLTMELFNKFTFVLHGWNAATNAALFRCPLRLVIFMATFKPEAWKHYFFCPKKHCLGVNSLNRAKHWALGLSSVLFKLSFWFKEQENYFCQEAGRTEVKADCPIWKSIPCAIIFYYLSKD